MKNKLWDTAKQPGYLKHGREEAAAAAAAMGGGENRDRGEWARNGQGSKQVFHPPPVLPPIARHSPKAGGRSRPRFKMMEKAEDYFFQPNLPTQERNGGVGGDHGACMVERREGVADLICTGETGEKAEGEKERDALRPYHIRVSEQAYRAHGAPLQALWLHSNLGFCSSDA